MTYHYRAYTQSKEIVEGTVEASSESNAEESLYQAGFKYILSLRASAPGMTIQRLLPTLFGIRSADIILFSRQLATFIASGISLLASLRLLERQATRPALRTVISGLIKEIEGGSSFSQALSRYPEVFSYTYCRVMKASELAGELEIGLKQMADYMERQAAIRNKARRALVYPSFISLLAIAIFVLLVTVVLPPMVLLYRSFNVPLPWATRAMIGFTGFFTAYGLQLLLAVLLATLGLLIYSRLPAGKRALDKLTLRLPVWGAITIIRLMGQFCRTAAMLLRAGLQLPQVIDVALRTVSTNSVIHQALSEVKEKMLEGKGFSAPLSENPLFPEEMVKMVAMGEQTGSVDTSLATLADYYEAQMSQRLQSLVSMIEPVVTVLIGLGVAFMLVAIILPLYSVLGALR